MSLQIILSEHTDSKLYIFDINWVLDNLLQTKVRLINEIFNVKDKIQLANVITALDRFYEKDKSSSLDLLLRESLSYVDISYSDKEIADFGNRYFSENIINIETINYLAKLSEDKKVCLYTSLWRNRINHLFWEYPEFVNHVKIYTKDDLDEPKPSVKNLIYICAEYDVKFEDTILIWDNIVVDLMPAKLLWMKTILVSPFVDSFAASF